MMKVYVPESPARSEHIYAPESPARSEHIYAPESPARSEHIYAPESPARSACYEPVSPRRKLNTFEKILHNIQNSTHARIHKERPYRKIHDWRVYCRLSILNDRKRYIESIENYENASKTLAANFRKINFDYFRWAFNRWSNRSTKIDNTEFIMYAHCILIKHRLQLKKDLDLLQRTQKVCLNISINERKIAFRKETLLNCIKEWRSSCPTPLPTQKEVINVSKDPYHVKVNLVVGKDGMVNAKVSAPLGVIYDKYINKLCRPPVDEYIVALREFGYPEWVLTRIQTRHTKNGLVEPERSVMEALRDEEKKSKTKKKEPSKLQKFVVRSGKSALDSEKEEAKIMAETSKYKKPFIRK